VLGRCLNCLRCRPGGRRASQLLRSTARGKENGVNSKFGHWVTSVFRSNFRAFTNTKRRQGPTANTGKGSGIATIEGDTATFKPEGAEGMPDHAKIHWRQTCSHSNRHLWIRSQRDRCRHLQKNFRKETKVRVGLTSALEFLLWNSVAAQHSRRRCPGGFAVYVAHPIRSIPAFLKDSEFEIGP